MPHRRSPIVTGSPGPNCPPHHWKILNSGHAYCMKPGCQSVTTFPMEVGLRIHDGKQNQVVEELSVGYR
jgi:hypothetical protein